MLITVPCPGAAIIKVLHVRQGGLGRRTLIRQAGKQDAGAQAIGRFDGQIGSEAVYGAVAVAAPVLRQSGKSARLIRPGYANNRLKRVFYQSAFCSLSHPLSRAFYDRKRQEGKRHHQAIIALARRRIDVPWALIAARRPFDAEHRHAA